MGHSLILKWGIYCLQNAKLPAKDCCSFLVLGPARYNNSFFTLEEVFFLALDHWTPRNLIDVWGPLSQEEFIIHLWSTCVTKAFRSLASLLLIVGLIWFHQCGVPVWYSANVQVAYIPSDWTMTESRRASVALGQGSMNNVHPMGTDCFSLHCGWYGESIFQLNSHGAHTRVCVQLL